VNARTTGYIIFIALVILLELFMIYIYFTAANEFEVYQLRDLFNFVKDNDFENGIGLLIGSIVAQLFLAFYIKLKNS
jgi:hypothetical protein